MKYFFDNCLSHKFVTALTALDYTNLVHLKDEFPVDAIDVDWMPIVAQRGWIVVTADLRIRSRPEERAVRERLKLTTIFFAGAFQNLSFAEQSWRIIRWWPDIVRVSSKQKAGNCLMVTVNGKVEDFK